MKIPSLFYLILYLIFSRINVAHAIDLQPGEIRALKPDTNLLMIAYQQSERGDRYFNGDKQSNTTEIQASQLQLRLGRSFEIAEYPAIFYVQAPTGYIHPEGSLSGLESDAGLGDATFLLAIWPYANHETKTYFAVGAYLTAPTGSYRSDRIFNMGQNRYSTALQAGYQAPLIGSLSGMVALDAIWFGDNGAFGHSRSNLEQKVLYNSQLALQYNINPRYSVAAAYFYTTGGETRVDGISRDDMTRLQRYQLTGAANFAFGRISLQYGGDLKTENGFIEDSRWILRYTKLY